MKDVRGIAHGLVDVVRDHDHGNVVAEIDELDEIVHLPRRHRVEPRHRLVEQEQLLRCAHGPGKQHALLLAAGELLIAGVFDVLDAHALKILFRAALVLRAVKQLSAERVETAREHDLPDAGREIALDLGLLRQVADLAAPEPVAERDPSGGGRLERQQPADQRGFAGAVFAYDAEIIPGLQRKVNALEHRSSVIGERGVFTCQNCHQPKASFTLSVLAHIRERYVAPFFRSPALTVWQVWKRSLAQPVSSQTTSAIFWLEYSIYSTAGV